MNLVAYITLEEAIAKHDEIILASGGLLGLRDEGLLISALTMIQNDFYYYKYHDKLAHLIFSINKNHCFIDGNKRASVSLGTLFLLKNGWPSEFIADFIIAMEEVVVWLANDEINKNDLQQIIKYLFFKLVSNNDYTCEKIKSLLNIYKLSEEGIFDLIQICNELTEITNDMISGSKELNDIDKIQIFENDIIIIEDGIINLEEKRCEIQRRRKIWELILKFLQN
ncbi:type II toxin-antitoxin system death-on-curing family toxin [Snodgrassella alvi]|uniref:type II toxin-antitoxin system death-on-curing family toxin n=1 Tax=Snodgrassella alvi TaxID=1196083 RepID=UPI000A013E0B|nr:type II toxin-antitoxin system death-on-curing family toxin [Snodgrassella alvi]ORF03855.1 hypothetical protein BGH97_01970 [Snodgrassella alvi]ORF09109.1 hypothetical protein BGH99_03525 [Snodgrassella alvi]ORF15114.1 hypothetical protein BGI00_01240 [Snodgrassella alvi]ORF15433.1 hypothetical protein BGI02_03375 [Snodgrassella alvi]ORF26450.1 hypothetical protein BGI06_01875 [Snodgrassella alvi]